MTRSFTLVYIAARQDAPEGLLSPFPAADWVYEAPARGFKIAAVPQEYAGRLLDRLRAAGALYAPEGFRFNYPTLQSAIANADAAHARQKPTQH